LLWPQFARYNAALRRWPIDDYELMKAAGNLYQTTMSVLVSAVQKIGRTMKLPDGLRLFRGLGGLMDLPKEFFTSDSNGRKGFVEWAFLSTTSDEQVIGDCEKGKRRRGGRAGRKRRAGNGRRRAKQVLQFR
jgi:hypothetical protein